MVMVVVVVVVDSGGGERKDGLVMVCDTGDVSTAVARFGNTWAPNQSFQPHSRLFVGAYTSTIFYHYYGAKFDETTMHRCVVLGKCWTTDH